MAVSVSWVFMLMIGISPPWLTNHVFAQSHCEMTKQTKTKQENPCVCVFLFSPPNSQDWYILKEVICIYLLPWWIKQLFTGALYQQSGFCSTKNLNQKNWFEKMQGKTGIRVSGLWSYSNHWVNPWLTECRERGFFAVIREIGLCNTSCVWRNAVVILPRPLEQYLNTSSCEEPYVYCGYFPRCLRSSCFVLSWT